MPKTKSKKKEKTPKIFKKVSVQKIVGSYLLRIEPSKKDGAVVEDTINELTAFRLAALGITNNFSEEVR